MGSWFIECVIPYNILDKEKQARMKGEILEKQSKEKLTEAQGDVGLKLSGTAQTVLSILLKNPKLSAQLISEQIGKATRTVDRAIKELVDKGYIRRVGSKKSGYYEIINIDRIE